MGVFCWRCLSAAVYHLGICIQRATAAILAIVTKAASFLYLRYVQVNFDCAVAFILWLRLNPWAIRFYYCTWQMRHKGNLEHCWILWTPCAWYIPRGPEWSFSFLRGTLIDFMGKNVRVKSFRCDDCLIDTILNSRRFLAGVESHPSRLGITAQPRSSASSRARHGPSA